MLKIDYRSLDRHALVEWDEADAGRPWFLTAKSMFLGASSDAQMEHGFGIALPWWAFLALRDDLRNLTQAYSMRQGVDIFVSPAAIDHLKAANLRADGYQKAVAATGLIEADVMAKLSGANFRRQLMPYQLRNICKLASMPAGATFSVPGAGKTTEALATYICRRQNHDKLLVIAPVNAFAAWDEQIQECLPQWGTSFVRLRNVDRIPLQLRDDPDFMIISYQQLALCPEVIADHLSERRVHVFLDESHRIKGAENVSTRTVRSFAHLPASKLVMSGTPMPQATSDLVPQFQFLFPEISVDEDDVTTRIQPIYVRTTKTELGLPPVTRVLRPVPMDALQKRLYDLMRSQVARDAASALSDRSRAGFRRLGRSVIRLLQFVSNPALLARDLGFVHTRELADAIAEGKGPKLRYVMRRARELAKESKKVLIWSSFVANVEYLSDALADLGAVYIHGGVGAGDEDDEETREGKIKLFHNDPGVMVMVANPAAASEGISLHHICHHAIYLDRTFNAAQYLQSEDRIHRIGLASDQETTIEIVECLGSVDEVVRRRLDFKVAQMGRALSDPGLHISPIRLDVDDSSGDDDIDEDDARALLAVLGNGS